MIYIGTSGWVYKEWAKSFYPKDVPVKERFAFYAKHFPTVEIDALGAAAKKKNEK